MIKNHNIFDAFKLQVIAEAGDKTFVLIFIFTIAWSNWHLDMDKPDELVNEMIDGTDEKLTKDISN